MPDLDKRIGPLSVRAWGLIANLLANVLMIYGLASVLVAGEGWACLAAGSALTAVLIAWLARPS